MRRTIGAGIRKIIAIKPVSTLAEKALRFYPRSMIFKYLGASCLSEIERFRLEGWNSIFEQNLSLRAGDTVWVLGGYFGDSAQMYHDMQDLDIHVFEPIPDFAATLRRRFEKLTRVVVHEFAVCDINKKLRIGLDNDKSSSMIDSAFTQEVEGRGIIEVLESLGTPDLIEINIEGGEYLVLPKLLQSPQILSIRTLIIQFHIVDVSSELQRSIIRNQLRLTHRNVYTYDFVWERWDLIGDDFAEVSNRFS